MLAKCFANVFIDFSWMHIVSPEVCRRALNEYLETIPFNKILGFGGDFIYAELTYAHAKMAQKGPWHRCWPGEKLGKAFAAKRTRWNLAAAFYTTMLPHCSLRNGARLPRL